MVGNRGLQSLGAAVRLGHRPPTLQTVERRSKDRRMTKDDFKTELKRLLGAHFPLVCINSDEEDRALDTIQELARETSA